MRIKDTKKYTAHTPEPDFPDEIFTHIARHLFCIRSTMQLSMVSKHTKRAVTSSMDMITTEFCSKDHYLCKLLPSENVFQWNREQWVFYVKEMERQRDLSPRINTIPLPSKSMEEVHVLCEVIQGDLPITFYVGIPYWITNYDHDSVTFQISAQTFGTIPSIYSRPGEPDIVHIYLVVDNKLHHWVTNTPQALYRNDSFYVDIEDRDDLEIKVFENVLQTESRNRLTLVYT